MGDLSEFSPAMRLFLKAYRWRRIDPIPWSPLRKPLSACNVALVTTAGFVMPGQPPFDHDVKGGDWSYREIRSDVAVAKLIESHRSKTFDHSGVRADPNLAFPLDRLHELRRDGVIGLVNGRHFSFMGSLTATSHLVKESAPAVARMLAGDGVDVALLVPI